MSNNQTREHEEQNSGVTISLSEEAKAHLQSFAGYEGAPFRDRMSALQFAVSLSIAKFGGSVPELGDQQATTVYNLGSFDSDQNFKEVIKIIAPEAFSKAPLTRLIRAYGEKGLVLMLEHCEGDPSAFELDEILASLNSEVELNIT